MLESPSREQFDQRQLRLQEKSLSNGAVLGLLYTMTPQMYIYFLLTQRSPVYAVPSFTESKRSCSYKSKKELEKLYHTVVISSPAPRRPCWLAAPVLCRVPFIVEHWFAWEPEQQRFVCLFVFALNSVSFEFYNITFGEIAMRYESRQFWRK